MRSRPVIALVVVLTLLLFGALATAASAAINKPPVWETFITGDGGDRLYTPVLSVDGAGSLYSAGSLSPDPTVSSDINVVRWGDAPDGWSRVWSAPGDSDNEAFGIAAAGDGVYVGGTTATAGEVDWALLKYTPSGGMALGWPQTWGEPGSGDRLARIAIDGAGNVIAAGTSIHVGDGVGERLSLVKYAASGSLLWANTSSGTSFINYIVDDLYVTPSGVTYVVGRREAGSLVRGFVAAYSASGVRRWIRVCNVGPYGGALLAVCGCPAGGVYAVGYARHGFKGGFEDALVTRYNAAGSRTLTKRYGVVGPSKVLTDVAVDPKGRIAVCGSWTRDRVGFYVALLRPAGTVVWSHRYDRGQGARLVIDGKGRVTASGTAVSPSGYPVVAVYAYATNGVLRWRSQSGGATGSGKLVTDMVRYGSSNVWVSGLSTDPDYHWSQLYLGWGL